MLTYFLSLRRTDIDWNGRFIVVRRSLKGGRINQTKTGKSRRVDMSDQLHHTLSGLYSQRKWEGLKAGRGDVIEWVFHRNGEPIAQRGARSIIKRTLREAGLREMRLRDILLISSTSLRQSAPEKNKGL